MKRLTVILAGVACIFAGTPHLRAQAAKPAPAKPTTAQTSTAKPAPGTKLPAAIETAFKAKYPSATINHVSKEKEGGKDVYEVESIDRGLARDLVYRPDGTVVNMEEALTPADVPAPVMAAFKARYPKATITKREKLTTGSIVQYEMQLTGANVKEVVLTPDGKFVSPK